MSQITYSGTRVLQQPKSVTIIDPIKGAVRFVSKVIHRFNNGRSLISFIRINPTTFVSTSVFAKDITGHYVVKLNQEKDLIEHRPFEVETSMIPSAYKNDDVVEEVCYEDLSRC